VDVTITSTTVSNSDASVLFTIDLSEDPFDIEPQWVQADLRKSESEDKWIIIYIGPYNDPLTLDDDE